MKKTNSGSYTNKNTKTMISVNERIANIRLQNNVNKESFEITSSTGKTKNYVSNVEEYPKLRRPKPATLLKIQTHKKKAEGCSKETEGRKNMPVKSGQECLNNKEKFTKYSLQKYDQLEIALDDKLRKNSDVVEPINLDNKQDLQLNKHLEVVNEPAKLSASNSTIKTSLNYCEQHVVNILHIKVKAHLNGFFAEDLPRWYRKTFSKDLPFDWLELIEASKQFDIEYVQNKTLLYAKETRENKNYNLNAYGDANPKHAGKECDKSVNFVRYKHLQKSLREYRKEADYLYTNSDKS